MIIDKNQVKRRFVNAADTYDQEAIIQKCVASSLLTLLKKEIKVKPRRVLEIGSCTGLLTKELVRRFRSISDLTVNDLADEFEPMVKEKINPYLKSFAFLAGDIEMLSLRGVYDLVISSSTFHWLNDLAGFLKKLQDNLDNDSILAFAMYGKDNLSEIKEITGIGLSYPDLNQLKEMVSECFSVKICEEHKEIFFFDDPLAVLNHLRLSGVNSLDRSLWTRKQLEVFQNQYRQRFENKGKVYLTYHPMYCIAGKATK